MSVRYIGSKARVVEDLATHIGQPTPYDHEFVDGFCGTGIVAQTAARLGWDIHLNDHLYCATIMAAGRLTSAKQAKFKKLGGYTRAIEKLNSSRRKRGFIWRTYSPASVDAGADVARMYFTESNAKKIDGIRATIARWAEDRRINSIEERLLLSDLLAAVNRVANIAGTYGCFLSHWLSQAMTPVELRPRQLFDGNVKVRISNCNIASLTVSEDDLVYLDPPYTKRQYAAYYHILETIVANDAPHVDGVTGLRPWQDKASDFCYRSRALRAITELVERLPSRRILLSYSDEGHVDLKPLTRQLRNTGSVVAHSLGAVGRYRPNKAASRARSSVKEHLLIISREPQIQAEAV